MHSLHVGLNKMVRSKSFVAKITFVGLFNVNVLRVLPNKLQRLKLKPAVLTIEALDTHIGVSQLNVRNKSPHEAEIFLDTD